MLYILFIGFFNTVINFVFYGVRVHLIISYNTIPVEFVPIIIVVEVFIFFVLKYSEIMFNKSAS